MASAAQNTKVICALRGDQPESASDLEDHGS